MDSWGDSMEDRYNRLDASYDLERAKTERLKAELRRLQQSDMPVRLDAANRRVAELESELEQKTEIVTKLEVQVQKCAALEAENAQLKSRATDLNRQYAEERLKSNRFEIRLARATNEWEDKLKKSQDEIAQLTDDKRKLQNTVRRQANTMNDTYAGPSSSSAAAAASAVSTTAEPPAPDPANFVTSTGRVEQWCITQYEGEITRLRRELGKRDHKIQELSDYVRHMKKKERDALKAMQPAAAPASSNPDP